MGGRDYNFQIVFRGKSLPYFQSGGGGGDFSAFK